ncbi:hypothetical protein P788_2802 [Enterococcus faecalis MTUP9]|jgi:hypothetical protein|nr:hypothetical protein P788_2802 [Enterococcus faecalis MTUP9]
MYSVNVTIILAPKLQNPFSSGITMKKRIEYFAKEIRELF